MKKIKLLTSLCSVGALVTTAPIIATSCSCSNEAKYKLELNKNKVGLGRSKQILVSIVDNDGKAYNIKSINSATSSNEDYLTVYGLSVINDLIGVVRVDALKIGTITLSITAVDDKDNEVKGEFTIEIIER